MASLNVFFLCFKAWRMEEGDAGVGGGAVEEGAEAEDVVVGLCPTTYPHSATPPIQLIIPFFWSSSSNESQLS